MSSSENGDEDFEESIFEIKSKQYAAKGTADSPISLSSNSPSSSPIKKKNCRTSVHEGHLVTAKRDIFMDRLKITSDQQSQEASQYDDDDEYDDSDESDESREPEPRCYCNDPALPVFSYSSLPMGKEKLVKAIIEKHPNTAVCCDQPINVKSNVTFLVDLSKLPHRDDVKCDDLGAWKHSGSPSSFCTVSKDGEVIFQSKKPKHVKEDMYKLKRVYYVHASSPDLKKKIAYVYDCHGEEMPICVVQYLFDGPEHEVAVRQPHGNSTKNKKAYCRTLSSVRDKMKESLDSKLTPKQCLDKIYKESGDVVGARSLGSLPSGPQSIYNARMSAKGPKSSTAKEDSIFIILEQARREAITAGSTAFIRDIKIHPEYCCVLATDKQLQQLQVFCTNPKEFCVLGVDLTFDIFDTNISLTMTTYRNLKLEHKETGKPPVFIGPLLMHQRKLRSTYGYFAHTLVSLHGPLKAVLAVGTDGEKALISGLQDHLMFAVFLRCFLHFEENLKSHLLSIGMPAKVCKEYLRDVFGEMRGSTFYQGLVDSTSEAIFDRKLSELKDTWNAREEPYVPKGKEPRIHD